jgi:hypothetical protein
MWPPKTDASTTTTSSGGSSSAPVLLLGEGDLSFAQALLSVAGEGADIVATTYESGRTVLKTYPGARSSLQALNSGGCRVLHSVALGHRGELRDPAPRLAGLGPFAAVVFNFPFADAVTRTRARVPVEACNTLSREDPASHPKPQWGGTYHVSVGRHRELLRETFLLAAPLLAPDGRLVLRLLLSQAVGWGVVSLAAQCGLRLHAMRSFDAQGWGALGYSPRRTFVDAGFVHEEKLCYELVFQCSPQEGEEGDEEK